MPTRQQLLSAGRQDLIGLINRVGGFTEVRILARSLTLTFNFSMLAGSLHKTVTVPLPYDCDCT
jgi:hypothetical protein